LILFFSQNGKKFETCLKKLDTVSVTGGKESSRHPMSVGAAAAALVSAALVAPSVLEEAHEDRLSFRSKDPLRVKDPPSPGGLNQRK
jgi:hypothetical protein